MMGGPPSMHGWGRRNKQPDTGQANSGLTGHPALEQPPVPEGPKDLRGRWDNLKQSVTGTIAGLPRVLRRGWECSPIGPLQQVHFTAVGMIVALAIVQLALFALTALLGTIRNITQQLLQNSVAMRIQLMVMEKAASLDLQFYEAPASYDLLRRAQTDSINRPVMMISTAFGLVQTLLTLVTIIALLVAVSPLLALIALISPIPAFIADTRYGWWGYNIARWGSRLLRRMNYLVTLVTTDTFAKEVKLFGLGRHFLAPDKP